MKKNIVLDEFAPIISSKESGTAIYELIKEANPYENEITIKAYDPLNMIYVFTLEDDNIVDYQRFLG